MMGLFTKLKARLHPPGRQFFSYLGPLDINTVVTKLDCAVFRRLQAYQMLQDVWVVSQDKHVTDLVVGRIMGVLVGHHGRPFYLIGYFSEELNAYEVVAYHGPIKRVKPSERGAILSFIE
jgi:hypothetical protein